MTTVTPEPKVVKLDYFNVTERRDMARKISELLNAPVTAMTKNKEAVMKNWTSLTPETSREPGALKFFSPRAPNIGVVLGANANGLCTIDCDSQDGWREFLELNPRLRDETLLSWALRGGNTWFRIKGTIPRVAKLKTRDGQSWGEFRGTGGLTIIDGTHPSGCEYHMNGRNPIEVALEDIKWPDSVDVTSIKRAGSKPSSVCLNGYASVSPVCPVSSVPLYGSSNLTPAQCIQLCNIGEEFLETNHYALRVLYKRLIEPKFTAIAGGRNGFLVEAVPYLYRVVAPALVFDLVTAFYCLNNRLFKDSLQKHFEEAVAMFNGVAATYEASLSPDEMDVYRVLKDDEQRTAFRIFRDLALYEDPEKPKEPLTFYLSCHELAKRMGYLPGDAAAARQEQGNADRKAHRHLERFWKRYSVLSRPSKGTTYDKDGKGGVASTYKWLLPVPDKVPPGNDTTSFGA
jgi:hypothetical protein